jgi:cyanophycinase
LIIIGGAEDKTGERRILREFVRLAGAGRARLVVIAVASDHPSAVGARYVKTFKSLGAEDARILDSASRDDANDPSAVKAIENATGVFFTGGTQLRITRLLGGTRLDTALHKRHEEGMVLAGTSAGAAMMSSIMIVDGSQETSLRVGMVELGPGMEFISGVLIDQHFEERGRLRRLLSAVAQYPRDLGLGIDENTAVVVYDQVFEVIGEGSVTVVDAGDLTYTNLAALNRHDLLTLCGVKVHFLGDGYMFDLRNRRPITDRSEAAARNGGKRRTKPRARKS